MSKYLICLVFLSFTFISCVDKQREEELAKKEEAIMLKEKQLEEKLIEYESLVKFRDSIRLAQTQIQDTIIPVIVQSWPDSLAGKWEAKMICTDSDCSNYNIGDRQTNFFEFAEDSTGISVKEFTKNNQLLRNYSVTLDNHKIRLKNIHDSLTVNPANYEVSLEHSRKNNLSGKRTVTRDDCIALFSLDLSRPKN